MVENNYPNPPIDPDLQRRLKQLRSVPARDPQMEARSEARFVAEVDEYLQEKGFSPSNGAVNSAANHTKSHRAGIITYYQQWKEKWKMATPKLRLAISMAAVFITLSVFMFGGVGMTAFANQNALPGDTLYGIKTGFEQTRLTLASDAADKARLNLDFAERRLDEIARLIESGRYADISLAVQEYEAYVQSAIASLETVAAGDPSSLAELAAQVADSLKRYAATLSGMTNSLPESARSELERAINVSISPGGTRDEIEFTGIVEQISAEIWVVASRTLTRIPSTEIKGQIEVGDRVKVHAYQDVDGNMILREIELIFSDNGSDDRDGFEYTGTVEQITAGAWVIAGRTLMITPASEVKGNITLGDMVKVEAWQDASGSWFLDEVELLDDDVMDDDSDDSMDDDSDDSMDDDSDDSMDDDSDDSMDDDSDDSIDDDSDDSDDDA